MEAFIIFCLAAAAVCFFLAASNVAVQRVGLVALGLFLWVLPSLVRALETVN